MTCDDVRALTSRGPLRTLTHDERESVLAHLDDCGLHPGLAEALAAAPQDVPPHSSTPASLALPGLQRVSSSTLRSQVVSVAPWLSAAVLGVLALTGWLRSTSVAAPQSHAPLVREANALTGPSRGTLTYDPASGLMLFAASDLPPASPDSEYQLWLIRGTTPLSLGTFAATVNGRASFGAELRLDPADAIAVTVEVAGGSPAPTSAPFLVIAYR